jgi:ABC transporter DrrB family efflux protein
MKAFTALVIARTMEFVRDTGSFAWSLLFPVVMIVGFAFAFSGNSDTLFKVGVLGAGDPALGFLKTPQTQFITYDAKADRHALTEKLRQHELDALVDTDTKTYWINDLGKNSKIIELLLSQQGGAAYSRQAVSGAPIRYVDRLVPGVIAMNLMFTSLFGVGYVLIRYRKNGVLKRMKATPVSALTFISAQGVSRLLIVVITSVLVYVGTNAFLGFRMEGSYLDLIGLLLLGTLSMIALGLALASRFRNEELANGIINLITWPMMLFSGVFFSLEGTPGPLQMFSQALPLTHFIQAARAIMLDGAGVVQLAPDFLFLGVFTALCLGLAAWLFRWD